MKFVNEMKLNMVLYCQFNSTIKGLFLGVVLFFFISSSVVVKVIDSTSEHPEIGCNKCLWLGDLKLLFSVILVESLSVVVALLGVSTKLRNEVLVVSVSKICSAATIE